MSTSVIAAPSATAAVAPSAERRHLLHRWASPSVLFAAALLFFLPMLSVSCDAPGGFGRMEQGGTTTYSGVDLAIGAAPSVDRSHLRPVAERTSDDVGVQPVLLLTLVGLLAAAALSVAVPTARAAATGLAALATVGLVVGVLLARSALADTVARDLGPRLPPGTAAGDYVSVGVGFWLTFVLAAIGAVVTWATRGVRARAA